MNVKPNSQNNYRSGTLFGFMDLVHELTDLNYDSEERTEEERQDKISNILGEIRSFDITTIGDLYLTSGGRIVLDKGYGEYFNNSDKVLFTLDKLKSGVNSKEFQKKLNDAIYGLPEVKE